MIPTALTQTEADVLGYLAYERKVLEVGSLLGYSTVALAKAARVVHSVGRMRAIRSTTPSQHFGHSWRT